MSGYADRHRQLTDKQAYTAALETQLQRATHALTAAQAFTEKVDVLQTQLNAVEDKVINITRLAKLQQSCSEGQEQEISRLTSELNSLMQSKSAHDSGMLSRKLENVELRLRNLEERAVDPGGTAMKARIVSEIDHSLRETENRIAAVLERTNVDFDHKQQIMQDQLTRAMEQCFQDCRALERRIAEVESRSSFGFQRNSLESLKLSKGGHDGNLMQELKECKESAWNSELTCNRLAEDSLNRIAACERLLRDLEFTVRDNLRGREVSVAKEELDALDRKLSEKLSDACNRLGDVVRASTDTARNLSTEVLSLERRTKSLERSVEMKRSLSQSNRQTMSFSSSPTFEPDVIEEIVKPERARSAPRAKTPPKKRTSLTKELERAQPKPDPVRKVSPPQFSKKQEEPKKSTTPPKKAVAPQKSPTPPKRSYTEDKQAKPTSSRSSKPVSPRLNKETSKERVSKKSLTPKKARTPRSKQRRKSPSPTFQTLSPSTLKSKARDDAIKDKFKKTDKKSKRRDRLEQLYQKLSAKDS
mmetsp:Transcript_10793/g.21123  ORF Transcript_10793/g.21123 Transcript_10793/m.21123 type:complete len:531 (-) Transcript_10793:1539-3131(-)